MRKRAAAVAVDLCAGAHALLLLLPPRALQIREAFDSAFRAALAVEAPADADTQDAGARRRLAFARRHAAETELKQRLAQLGLDASGLSLAPEGAPAADLLSLARPLSASSGVLSLAHAGGR